MKRVILILFFISALSFPVSASGIVAPSVPDDVEQLLPAEQDDFGNSLFYILREAFDRVQPQVASCVKIGMQVVGSTLILALLRHYNGKSKAMVELAGVLVVSGLLLDSSNSLIQLGTNTVWQISQYGKLLLPVMAAALAAQGGSISATSLYGATALFDTILSALVSSVLIPMVYVYIVLSIMNAASNDTLLTKLRDLMKWIMTWSLKIMLYIFTGYISITGLISGAADQTAVKAAKITISGMVPVVGGILSDASETILISAAVVKNSVGIYGMLGIIAVMIIPFMTIGMNYLSMKLTAAFSTIFAPKNVSDLLGDFTSAMGLVLGMTGSVCLIQLISVVCFLKGMS